VVVEVDSSVVVVVGEAVDSFAVAVEVAVD